MKYRLSDLIDIDKLQQLLDTLNEICSFPSAIIDNQGTILTSTAWQDVCTKFHRVNSHTKSACIKSDRFIAENLHLANPAISYKCPHGLVDNATPIIIGGEHLANFFTGQFFLEEPDMEFFRNQAGKYGFDETEYLKAVEKVPVWSQQKLDKYLSFIKQFTETIGEIGLKHLKATETTEQLYFQEQELLNINEELRQTNEELYVAKERAEENEEKFRRLFQCSPIGNSLTYLDGTMHVNDAFGRMLGYSTEELSQLKWSAITHPDDIEKSEAMVQLLMKGAQEQLHFEKRYLHKNGSIVWADVFTFLQRDGNENPQFYITAVNDITFRKQYEQQLIKAKEKAEEGERLQSLQKQMIELNNNRLESLLKISQLQSDSVREILDFALNEAIRLTQSKIGYIYFYNETDKQFILNTWSNGVMKECAVVNPETVYDLDSTGCWGEAVRQRRPIIINDYPNEEDLKRGLPEGHVKLEKFLTIPVIFENRIVAVAGVANKESDYDSSDVRQLSLLMDSVWKITERINLIRDLTQAREKAEEANRLKSQFLNNMSHEIRTPMNGIIGFSQMLDMPNLSDEKRRYFSSIIQNSSFQLLTIIDDILEISTLETNQVTIVETPFCLNDLLEELLPIYELKGREREIFIHLKCALPDDQSHIVSDPARLTRIIKKLLDNALKFTNEGSIEFGYSIEESNLVIFVTDTGIGIPVQHQLTVFDRFSQGDSHISINYGGLGLGLSIARGNARLIGGDILLKSEPGRGSTFYLTLMHKPATTAGKTAVMDSREDLRADHQYTVLVAEDEEVNYLYIEALFEQESDGAFTIIRAKNGKEAVEICMQNQHIDMVLMDIKMPVMDGHEATRKIKSMFPNLPVIAQTAYSTEPEKELALEQGCNDFISKPIKREELFGMIHRYLMPE